MYFIRGFWTIVYYTHCGSRRKSDITFYCSSILPGCYRLFFKTKIHVAKYKFVFFTILVSRPVGYYYVYVVWVDRLWSSSDLVKSWGGGGVSGGGGPGYNTSICCMGHSGCYDTSICTWATVGVTILCGCHMI